MYMLSLSTAETMHYGTTKLHWSLYYLAIDYGNTKVLSHDIQTLQQMKTQFS